MATPSKEEKVSSRELLIRAAANAFSLKGFSGTNVRDIAKDAGVGFQLIQYYFGSKQALLEEVVEYLYRQDAAAGLRHLEVIAVLPPKEQLTAQIHAVVSYKFKHPELNRILLIEAMQDSKEYQLVHDKAVEGLRKVSRTFLGKMQKAGVVKTDIPLDDLVHLFQGALLYRILSRADTELFSGKKGAQEKIIAKHANAIIKLLEK